jgi:hypothetical protein
MVNWLWTAAPEHHRTIHDVASRMFIHFASISTTSEVSDLVRAVQYLTCAVFL